MSSGAFRTAILNHLKTNTSENIIDLSGEYEEVQEMLTHNGLQMGATWVGVQFFPSDEFPVDVVGEYKKGHYREEGMVYLHIVDLAYFGAASAITTRADAIRDLLRGARISNNIVIEKVVPVIFGRGATLNFEGGYTAGLVSFEYRRDFNVT